ncbi:MAG: DUF1971 domain-containing protein [Marinovum sp.]|nr:DUF1971 domain-containing protein [Marinovum sp.]
MTYEIPENVKKYSESPIFTHLTVPSALTATHRTKPGTWGRLVVLEGALIYTREGHSPEVVSNETPATIYPAEPHFVTCNTPVRFKVEFLRLNREENSNG